MKVLVIDDSPSTLEMVSMMLEDAGHQVSSCADGKRARQLIGREVFDLIVTDIYMPEEDGLQLILEARRLHPSLPIVAMSGMTGMFDMLNVAQHLGACQVLRKPFSAKDLLAAAAAAKAGAVAQPASSSSQRGIRQ